MAITSTLHYLKEEKQIFWFLKNPLIITRFSWLGTSHDWKISVLHSKISFCKYIWILHSPAKFKAVVYRERYRSRLAKNEVINCYEVCLGWVFEMNSGKPIKVNLKAQSTLTIVSKTISLTVQIHLYAHEDYQKITAHSSFTQVQNLICDCRIIPNQYNETCTRNIWRVLIFCPGNTPEIRVRQVQNEACGSRG
jgi:hypothetical protein